jgi:hypothetical protein
MRLNRAGELARRRFEEMVGRPPLPEAAEAAKVGGRGVVGGVRFPNPTADMDHGHWLGQLSAINRHNQ